nr:mediator of RNA polymerase II transcription subunit 15A-like isoform X2 [Ipomoea batatas]GMC68071.1 mediator of RNA polymerase II transcription subunit 15A-like isoform X2 [Ipomoea batatas]
MDGNNWRTAQAQGQAPAGDATAPAPVAANGAVETGDWRAQLQPESRQRIVNKMLIDKHEELDIDSTGFC